MRALTIADGRLEVAERPLPEPGPDDVVVRVHGAGLNRGDLAQLAGHYPAPPGVPPDIPGLEFAGEVANVGSDVRGIVAGDVVFGIAGGGAQAEYISVPSVQCADVPDDLDPLAMGGVPEAFITAHDAMVRQAELVGDEWLVVHAVGSGVGTTILQLAKAFGALVVGTARSPDKLARCKPLGLDLGLVPPLGADGMLDVDTLAWSIIEATDGGAHVTLDLLGGRYVEVDVAAAATRGRIVCIGAIAGAHANLPITAIMAKRLQVFGTVLRPRTTAEKGAATAGFVRDVVPLLASGDVAPIIDATFPLEDAQEAYDLLRSDTTFGKVVLDCM